MVEEGKGLMEEGRGMVEEGKRWRGREEVR